MPSPADAPVPFLDLRAPYRELQSDIDAALSRVASNGRFVLGKDLERFEESFALSMGARFAVGVGSGLDALRLALEAHGVTQGDEVVVPTHTFIATWLAVSALGATVVPVDPSEGSFVVDSTAIEAALTSRTRAIVPVHLYGHPVDLEPILALAEKAKIPVVADAAQAHGARYRSHQLGGFGTAAWSFYPGKNLGAFGDGGAVTTNDQSIADRIRSLRNYGSSAKYVHEVIGSNSRLDDIQAAVLAVKLGKLEEWNRRRSAIAATYLDGLADTDLRLPSTPEWAQPVWHLFVVRSDRRDDLQNHLAQDGVEALIHYPVPPHLQGAYDALSWKGGAFPIAERLATEVLSLPIGPHVSQQQAIRVVDSIRTFFTSH